MAGSEKKSNGYEARFKKIETMLMQHEVKIHSLSQDGETWKSSENKSSPTKDYDSSPTDALRGS